MKKTTDDIMTNRVLRQTMRAPFHFEGIDVLPGTQARVPLSVGLDPLGRDLSIPVHILHGEKDGPILTITSTIHGDELNGVTIIRHLLYGMDLKPETSDDLVRVENIRGTLLIVPVCNPEAVILDTRRSSDGRDLNRCFPGSPNGTHSARIAHALFEQVVMRGKYLIDLHTAPARRTNAPHIRANCDREDSKDLARAFGTPIVLHSIGPEGSLRRTATGLGIHSILLEAGTANVFEGGAIAVGVQGIMNVMIHLDMIDGNLRRPEWRLIVRKSRWIRSPRGGMLHPAIVAGELVDQGQPIAHVTNPLSGDAEAILSPMSGVAVGLATSPIVREGDPVANIASVQKKKTHQKIRAAPMTEWTIKDVSETLEDISDDESGACIDDTPEDEE
tara:strand:+ start:476 stop:1642 length:1167 start_codon:yes stop_codon:yes gene_type:complete